MNHKTRSSYRPITSFGQIILWTDFRLDQSHPLDGSSFGQIFVSTNHILRTDHPSDGLSYQPITSFGRTIFRTNFCIAQSHPSDGPSFGRTFCIDQSDCLDGYLTVINGHILQRIYKIGWSDPQASVAYVQSCTSYAQAASSA